MLRPGSRSPTGHRAVDDLVDGTLQLSTSVFETWLTLSGARKSGDAYGRSSDRHFTGQACGLRTPGAISCSRNSRMTAPRGPAGDHQRGPGESHARRSLDHLSGQEDLTMAWPLWNRPALSCSATASILTTSRACCASKASSPIWELRYLAAPAGAPRRDAADQRGFSCYVIGARQPLAVRHRGHPRERELGLHRRHLRQGCRARQPAPLSQRQPRRPDERYPAHRSGFSCSASAGM